MPRFNQGDRVRIISAVPSPFAGLQGVVTEVKPDRRKLTQLDSYVVMFEWGEKQSFWDAQLEPAGSEASHRKAG